MASAAFDPFEVLGLERGASQEQVRAAYRELVARYHPDKHRGNPLEELAAAKLVEINRAYEILSDEAKRSDYESRRTAQPSSVAPSPAGTSASLPPPIAKLLNSLGVIISLILFLRFGLGLARSVLMGLLAVMRMGPIFAIAVVVALVTLGNYLMRGRRKS
jgi:preprotein translocase subunit Sec63